MDRRPGGKLLILAVLLATLVASMPGAASGQATGGGVTQSEIRLGMSAAFSGNARALGIELYRGTMAYFQDVNDAGGVNGRRIVVKAYDDRYEPEPTIRNTLRLMNEDDVFALFDYVGTPTMNRTLPLLRKYRDRHFVLLFPFTGANTNRIPPYDKFSLNLRASYAEETGSLVDHFVAIGRTRIAVFYQADSYGRAGWAGVRAGLARHGLEIAGEATYRRGTPFSESFDPQVALMQQADPDAIVCVGAYAACAGFVRDARARSLDVPIGTISFVGSEAMLDLLTLANRTTGMDLTSKLVSSQVVPSYYDDALPAVREYKAAMARYRDRIMPPPALLAGQDGSAAGEYQPLALSFTSFEGFLNAKLLVEILRRMGPDPTRAGITPAAMTIRDLDLGTGERLSFGGRGNARQASHKVYFTIVEDGRFVPFSDADWTKWAKP